ncbi:MAG: iron-containing redox enzyme family protein [Candidatus Binataceae bacterium]
MNQNNSDIVDHIIETSLRTARTYRWVSEPLTAGGAKAFVLQHILRNRFYSAVMRPAWMSRCPDLAIVRKTIGQMREELVCDDKINKAHTDILWEFGRNIGLSDERMNSAAPEPMVTISFNALENLARTRHWLAGWLGSSIEEFLGIALEGHTFNADTWKRVLGLSEEQVFFMRYHEKADLDHAGRAVWEPIRRHVTSPEIRGEIEEGLTITLEANRCFYEGVASLGERLDREISRAAASA